jgi:transposase
MSTQNRSIQFLGITPEEQNKPLFKYIDKKFDEFKELYKPKKVNTYLTRSDVAKMLKIDLSSVYNWTRKGTLKSYQISGRVYYKLAEIESAIVELKR